MIVPRHLKKYAPAFAGDPALKWLQYVVLLSVVLYFGRNIFIPLSFAILVSFVLYPVCRWLESKGTGRMTAIIISLSLLVVAGILLLLLLVSQFVSFLEEWPALQTKLSRTLQDVSVFLSGALNIPVEEQKSLISRLSSEAGGNIFSFLRSTISASAFSLVLLVLVPVYVVLILNYRRQWMDILYRIFPHQRREELAGIISLTIKAYYNFIKGMAVVYLVVGLLNSVGLLLLGVPHAVLFGFIAAILTFIPYVGIIVGSLLPMTMAWITYDSVWYPVGVVGVFALVQYLEANVIFPLAVSSRLNVNTLVMLVAIFAGGILWGVAGMILFVPFIGIAKLIADHNPEWKTTSMILGVERQR